VTAPPSSGFGTRDLLVVVAMNLLWGFNILAVKAAVELVPPLAAGFARQVIVLLVCAGSLRIVPGKMRPLIALGILTGGFFYIFINLSLAVSDNVGALAIAGQLGVPFSLLLAIIVFKERIHWPRLTGIMLAFAGVGLLVFDPAAAREGPGLALTAAASFIWAICSLIQRHLKGVPVLTIYAWVGLMGALVLGLVGWWAEPQGLPALAAAPVSVLFPIAFSAIGSTVLGQGAMVWLLQRHPVSTITPLTLAAPVVSVFAAAYWFGTPLTWPMLAGGAVAMLGVGIVTMRTAKANERQGNGHKPA
jgi:O-acetylserine/cysteine efflux transporter